MKLLKELNFDDLKGKKRDELIEMLEEELKHVSDTEIISMVCRLRTAAVESQKLEMQTKKQSEIDKLDKYQEILKSEEAELKEKQKAYEEMYSMFKKKYEDMAEATQEV